MTPPAAHASNHEIRRALDARRGHGRAGEWELPPGDAFALIPLHVVPIAPDAEQFSRSTKIGVRTEKLTALLPYVPAGPVRERIERLLAQRAPFVAVSASVLPVRQVSGLTVTPDRGLCGAEDEVIVRFGATRLLVRVFDTDLPRLTSTDRRQITAGRDGVRVSAPRAVKVR